MVSMRDVASAAGVSHGTVSHALNHPERVSPETLARVQRAVEELGFVRNEAARHLRAGQSTTLGLILIDNWDAFFNLLTTGFEDAVIGKGWTVIVANSALDVARERANLDTFEQRRLRGILIIPQSKESVEDLVRVRQRGTSCVLVDRDAGDYPIPSVSVDDVAGGRMAGEHLVSIGRSKIMFVGNPRVLYHAADRLQGLREGTAGAASIEVRDVDHLVYADGLGVGAAIARRSPKQRPDGIFCANDLLALAIISVLIAEGIRVPEDIAIVGYDDVSYAGHGQIPLTSIRQPAYDLGRQAGEVLLRDISNERSGPIERLINTPEFVPRDSTLGPRRSADAGLNGVPAGGSVRGDTGNV